jgi:hypothetical protein
MKRRLEPWPAELPAIIATRGGRSNSIDVARRAAITGVGRSLPHFLHPRCARAGQRHPPVGCPAGHVLPVPSVRLLAIHNEESVWVREYAITGQ